MTTETDERTAFLDRLRAYEGMEVGVEVGADPVNQPMIRHWVEAIGDENPVYVDPDAAARSVHGQVIAPAVMLQAWVMRGIRSRPAEGGSPRDEMLRMLDEAGFSSVVATNCEQQYERMLHVGDHLRTRTVIDSISDEKRTALGGTASDAAHHPGLQHHGRRDHLAVHRLGRRVRVDVHGVLVADGLDPVPDHRLVHRIGALLDADLVGCDPSEITIGMPVVVEWQDLDDDLSLPAFKPAS